MYKKNSLNLFLNTESDNMSSEFDLLKKLQKETKQNTNDISPTSTNISELNNKNNLSTTSEDNLSTTSDDKLNPFIKPNNKSYLSNVLKKHVNTNSTTSDINTSQKNKGNYSDEMTPAISSSLVLKMKKSQQDKDPARGSSQTY